MSLLAKFQASIKEPQWLQMVGVILAFGGLIAHSHWYGIPMAYIGLGVAVTGRLFESVYT